MSAAVPLMIGIEGGPGSEPPSEGNHEVTQERLNDAVRRLNEYKNNPAARKTDEDLARELGGRWKPNSIAVFRGGHMKLSGAGLLVEAVEALLAEVAERQKLITGSVYVNTSISKRLISLIKRCTLFKRIGVAAVEPGLGKTTTLRHYVANAPLSVFIPANKTFAPRTRSSASASPWPMFNRLLLALQIESNHQYRAYDQVVTKLKGSNRVILIDQAQYVPPEGLDLLTTIHEEAETPIILFGHTHIYNTGPREFEAMVAFQSRAFREMFTRQQVTPSDVVLISEQFIGRSLAEAKKRELLDQVMKDGGLRRLEMILQHAQTLATGDTVSAQNINDSIDYVAKAGGV